MPEASVAIHCTPGDAIECRCANDQPGFHYCRSEAGEWSSCQCEPEKPIDENAFDGGESDDTLQESANEPDAAESDDTPQESANVPDAAESDDTPEESADGPDEETGVSTGCRTDADCTDPAKPYCEHYETNRCVECMGSFDCAGDEKCDSKTKTCKNKYAGEMECATYYDCHDPLKPVCDIFETQKCVECMVNADCDAGWRCDTANRSCVKEKAPADGYSCPAAEKCFQVGDERYCFAENGEIPDDADYCFDFSESCADEKLLYMSETGAGDDSKINCRCLNKCAATPYTESLCKPCDNDGDCGHWEITDTPYCVQMDAIGGKFCGTGDFITDMINCL